MFNFEPFNKAAVNDALSYQLSALPVAALAALVTFTFAGRGLLRYLNPGRSGAMKTLTGTPGSGRWETDAWPISFLMIAVMSVAAFFQVLPNGFEFDWLYSLLVIPFAASNALIEEVIFRLSSVSVGASVTRTAWYGLIMGSVVFGVFQLGSRAQRSARCSGLDVPGLLPGQVDPGNEGILLGLHDPLHARRGDPALRLQRRVNAVRRTG